MGRINAQIKKYWPEAEQIERMQTGIDIEFSDRFEKPDWWKGK
jgi:hypothetical protein